MSSDKEVVAVTPRASAGTVKVQVTISAGEISTNLSAGSFTYAPVPTVKSAAADGRQATSVTLAAVVNPHGLPLTGCEFAYGATSRYGKEAACAQTVAATSQPVTVSAALTGLRPTTRYHYRITVTTAVGTVNGPDASFTTPQWRVVGTPLIGLLLERVTNRLGFIGQLLGIQGIRDAVPGESLSIRCVQACARARAGGIALDLKLDSRAIAGQIKIPHALLLSGATRIEIDVSARGELSRYARYAFTLVDQTLSVRITASGCLGTAGQVVRCPTPHDQA